MRAASRAVRRLLVITCFSLVAPLSLLRAQAVSTEPAHADTFALRFELPRDSARGSLPSVAYRHPGADSTLSFGDPLPIHRRDVQEVRIVPSGGRGEFTVLAILSADGASRLRRGTAGGVGRRLGIIVGGELVSLPLVAAPLASRMLPVATAVGRDRAQKIARDLGYRG